MTLEDRATLTRALAAYRTEYSTPDVTAEVKEIAAGSTWNDSWTHVACMVAALRDLGVIA